jgi:predicted methyltransferase
MRRVLHGLLISALPLIALACAGLAPGRSVEPDAADRDALVAATQGPHRSEKNVARDLYRHPVETLSFFGLQPDMTVIEILPGGLWYTEIIAPFVAEQGQYVAAWYDLDLPDQPAYRTRGYQTMLDRFEQEADVFGAAKIAKFSPPTSVDLGAPGSADMVLTFRSTHGWLREGSAQAAYAAFFRVLKPGGTLGVVQHRAGARTDSAKFTGYVPQETVIALAEEAGFVLEASSEINANPNDPADYPGGVWTLPPTLREGDVERARYLAIGESDRMTLRFRKPAN